MKKLLFIASLLALSVLRAEEFKISELSEGMVTNRSANKIPDKSAALIQNFLTDEDMMAMERNGFVQKESTVLGGGNAVTGLWSFTDTSGNEYIVAFASRTFYKSTPGNAFSAFGPITTNSNVPDCAVNLGLIMCVNGTDAAWTYNGTATATVSGAPIGRFIEPWRQRFAIANITNSQSTVRFSEDGSATNWVLGSTPTAPFSILVGGANNGRVIRCFRGSYQDNMVIMKQDEIYSMSGFDQADVDLREVNTEIGCLDDRTVQEIDGSLYWLSNRGIEKRTANTIENISEPIRPLTDLIVNGTLSGEKSASQTSRDDWDAGTKTSTDSFDTTTVLGDLTAKTFSNSITSFDDFNSGVSEGNNSVYADTYSAVGQLRTQWPEEFHQYRDGADGSQTANIWDLYAPGATPAASVVSDQLNITVDSTAGGGSIGGIKTVNPIRHLLYGTTIHFSLTSVPDGNNVFIGINTSSTVASFLASNTNSSAFTITLYQNLTFGSRTKLEVSTGTPGSLSTKLSTLASTTTAKVYSLYLSTSALVFTYGGTQITGTHSFANLGDVPVYLYLAMEPASSGGTSQFDFVRISPQSFKFTSVVKDMGYGTGDFSWDKFYDTSSSSGTASSTITYQVRISSNNSTFTSGTTVSSGTIIGAGKMRYEKTVATFFHDDINNGSPLILYDMSSPAYSSGTVQSSTINLGGVPTSWRQVQITKTDPGSKMSFQFNASTSSNYFNPSSWTTVSNGQIPTNGLAQYVALKSSFSITNATNVATLNSFSINYLDGSSTALTSAAWNRRYMLSFSTTNNPTDKTLVWQRNQTWTIFDGLNAASWARWKNGAYFGNSDSTGLVYQFDVGNTDNGSSIDSKIVFKSHDLGIPWKPKAFGRNLYALYLGDTSLNGSFSLSYQLDRDGNTYSLGSADLNEHTGQALVKFPFPMANSMIGREIQYTLSKSGTGGRLRLYDLVTEYEVKEPD